MKDVSQPATSKLEQKKRTIVKYGKISLAAFLSLLVWGLHFIGKTTELIGDFVNELKKRISDG